MHGQRGAEVALQRQVARASKAAAWAVVPAQIAERAQGEMRINGHWQQQYQQNQQPKD